MCLHSVNAFPYTVVIFIGSEGVRHSRGALTVLAAGLFTHSCVRVVFWLLQIKSIQPVDFVVKESQEMQSIVFCCRVKHLPPECHRINQDWFLEVYTFFKCHKRISSAVRNALQIFHWCFFGPLSWPVYSTDLILSRRVPADSSIKQEVGTQACFPPSVWLSQHFTVCQCFLWWAERPNMQMDERWKDFFDEISSCY